MTRLPYTLSAPIGSRASFGLIVLQADETIEHEFRQIFAIDGVALYVTRIPSGADVTPESLGRMKDALPAAAHLLPPSVDFRDIAYACTSGATMIGPETVAAIVREATGCAVVTDPLTATIAALEKLDARRLAFLTPYRADVSLAMRTALESAGIEIAGFGSFEEESEARVARIDPRSLLEATLQVARQKPCDAVFLACTNLRGLGIIGAAEQELGVPVITSNQALAWHMLRRAGITSEGAGIGKLMEM